MSLHLHKTVCPASLAIKTLCLGALASITCPAYASNIISHYIHYSCTSCLMLCNAGLLAVSFGPCYTYVLLRLVYGQKWSNTEAPKALAYYCAYITLLALNGCTEAYVNAVADTR